MITFLLASLLSVDILDPAAVDRSLVGKRITVEGVYSGQGGAGAGRFVRLIGGKTPFRVRDVSLGTVRTKMNVRIVGDVRLLQGELVVDMVSWEPLPSDLETYDRRAEKIKDNDYDSWEKLSLWAIDRFQRFGAPGLDKKADLAYRTSIAVQRQSAGKDPAALETLLRRIREQNRLPQYDFSELEHEILRLRGQELLSDPTKDSTAIEEFAERVRGALRGTRGTPPPPLDPASRERYETSPSFIFAREPERRPQFARFWEVALMEEARRRDAEKNNRDPFDLYERARRDAPDYPEFARQWLQRAVANAKSQLPTLSKQAIDDLSQRAAEGLGDSKIRGELTSSWLAEKERAMRDEEERLKVRARRQGLAAPPGDARARQELAAIYNEWFPDDSSHREKAAALLKEALAIDPQFAPARAQLKGMGYALGTDGKWRREVGGQEVVPNRSATSFRRGMAADEVVKTNGQPDRKARIVTSAGVTHQWTYQSVGEKVVVFLTESSGGEIRLSEIHLLR